MGYQWDTRPGKREPKNELERSTMLFSWENSLFQWPWLLCRKLWMSLPEAMSECSTDPPVALLVKSQAESDIDMTSRSLETIQHLEYSWDIWSDEYSWENPMAKIIISSIKSSNIRILRGGICWSTMTGGSIMRKILGQWPIFKASPSWVWARSCLQFSYPAKLWMDLSGVLILIIFVAKPALKRTLSCLNSHSNFLKK